MRIGLGLGLGLGSRRGGGAIYSAEALAYFAEMLTQGDDAYKLWIDTYIKKLKADGLWAKISAMWLLGNKDQNASFINMKNPAGTKAQGLGGIDGFTAYSGWNAGAGAGKAIDTGISPATLGLTENNAFIGVYSLTDIAATTVDIGARGTVDNSQFGRVVVSSLLRNGYQQNALFQGIKAGGVAWTGEQTPKSDGFHLVNKNNTSTSSSYRNNTVYGTSAQSANGVTTRSIYLCAMNGDGAVSAPSASTILLGMICIGLSDAEIGLLKNHVEWLTKNSPGGDKWIA